MKKIILSVFILYVATLLMPVSALAACSSVKIEILQELTLERIAFDAKLKVTNNMPDQSLTNVRVDLIVRDAMGNDKGSMFFVKAPDCTNITDVSGTGSVAPSTEADTHWLIIPSAGNTLAPGAGGTDPAGVLYWVGATMSYTVNGVQQTMPINPCSITVKPECQLYLDYFTPYQVLGDNPMTKQVEAPVPYPLAVRVFNDGYGPAKNLKMTSAQPKIVDNKQGLLIGFNILGTSVNDQPVTPFTLTPALGDVASKKCATASWQMISTLSGVFQKFDVSFTHASELGGDLTSLVKATTPHYLVHMVHDNLPGRDARLDFLYASDDPNNPAVNPVYGMAESEVPPGKTDTNITDYAWSLTPVTKETVTPIAARPTHGANEVSMTAASTHGGWIYASTDDPGMGLLKLASVVRTDGRMLDQNNFWIQEYLDKDYHKKFSVNILDNRLDVTDPATYRLVYENPPLDTIPPVTTLVFDDPYILEDTPTTHTVYMLPVKNVMFTAQDNDKGSGVQYMKKRFGNETSFSDAYPFSTSVPGTYTLDYYSVDYAGNKETTRTEKIVIDGGAPVITGLAADPVSFSPGAPAGIKAQRTAKLTLKVTDDVSHLPVTFDIAKGEGDFAALTKVKTITATAALGADLSVDWDGKCDDGTVAPVGKYTVRATVTDGLNASASDTSHTSSRTAALTVAGWFTGKPLDPNLTGEQLHAKVSGTKAVWQDKRSGNWQVRMKDLSFANSSSIAVSPGTANAERPCIDGNTVAWQEQQGSAGVYRVRFSNVSTTAYVNPGADAEFPNRSEERPAVSGDWIAWQDNRNGNWDIFARDLNNSANTVIQITNHERDQMNPVISGGKLYWEDYRFGASELYSYDFATSTETRLTFDMSNQTAPAVSGNTLVWTDNRDGNKAVYMKDGSASDSRVSYGQADDDQPSVLGSTIAYTDYAKGVGDTELAFYDILAGIGGNLTDCPGRQEEAAVGAGYIIWQDSRDGVFQIYYAPFGIEPVPVTVAINKGYNLIAAGGLLAQNYATASALINAVRTDMAVDRVMMYDAFHGSALEMIDGQASGTDFAITPGSGIVLYAGKAGSLDVAASGESLTYSLLPGMNQIGIVRAPYGYSSYDMMNSVGLDNIQSVRRFNPDTGGWETASVRTKNNANEIVGVSFPVRPGDGLIVNMKQRVDGWKP